VLIFRDVTAQRLLERDKANQLLTARLLAAIVESSNDAIIGKSLDGIIQSWNAAAEHLFGYTAEQAINKHISLIIPPERIAEEDEIIARLKEGQRIEHFETERVRSDGQLDGHEVCRHVREQPWGKDIVIIALTGWGQEDDRRKSEEAGFNGHLVKPVDYDKLLALLS